MEILIHLSQQLIDQVDKSINSMHMKKLKSENNI